MLFYDLSQRGDVPLYDYLYKCIRHDIAHGAIAAGEKLPSKRALAKHLGVGVITVEAAYTQLIAEGYMRAEERRGYFACELAPAVRAAGDVCRDVRDDANPTSTGQAASSAPTSCESLAAARGSCGEALAGGIDSRGRRALGTAACRSDAPGELGVPGSSGTSSPPLRRASATPSFSGSAATSLFPYATWAKVMRQTLSEETSASLAEAASAAGSLRLRQAISAYLREFRGMDAPASRIVVAAGSQTLYQLLVQLLGRDRLYAVEQPGYALLAEMYRAQGAPVCAVPVTAHGLDVDALGESGAQVAHVMPAHQFPTGAVMSATCRRSLLNWSRKGADATCVTACAEGAGGAEGRNGAEAAGDPSRSRGALDASAHPTAGGPPLRGRFVIEDDYDAEFRMSGRPIPPLASIDSAGRVIYLNSFAKSLGAAFRIAYMVLPPALHERFSAELGFYSNTVSPLEQLALARFIEQGHYERHVNRLRVRAKRAQDAVVAALDASSLKDRLKFVGLDGGFHFSMSVKAGAHERGGAASLSRADEGALRSLVERCGAQLVLLSPGRYVVNFEQAVAATKA